MDDGGDHMPQTMSILHSGLIGEESVRVEKKRLWRLSFCIIVGKLHTSCSTQCTMMGNSLLLSECLAVVDPFRPDCGQQPPSFRSSLFLAIALRPSVRGLKCPFSVRSSFTCHRRAIATGRPALCTQYDKSGVGSRRPASCA